MMDYWSLKESSSDCRSFWVSGIPGLLASTETGTIISGVVIGHASTILYSGHVSDSREVPSVSDGGVVVR